VRRRLTRFYGADPLHLLALLASLAIAGFAVAGWFERPYDVGTVLVWFIAAIVAHDLVLLPFYSLLDRIAFGRGRERSGSQARSISPIPYLRIPSLLSSLLLLVFFPEIFGLGMSGFRTAAGHEQHGYLLGWLAATGAMFAISGLAYAWAVRRADLQLKRRRAAARPRTQPSRRQIPPPR
jgi:hypothetical protein